jgi:hypothetical protein
MGKLHKEEPNEALVLILLVPVGHLANGLSGLGKRFTPSNVHVVFLSITKSIQCNFYEKKTNNKNPATEQFKH